MISEPSVARYLRTVRRRGDAGQSWRTFLANHREAIVAFNFFAVSTARFKLLYCFFVIAHGRRKVLHSNVTAHPNAEWVVQQLREAFLGAVPFRYVIFDRDAKFNSEVAEFLVVANAVATSRSFRSLDHDETGWSTKRR